MSDASMVTTETFGVYSNFDGSQHVEKVTDVDICRQEQLPLARLGDQSLYNYDITYVPGATPIQSDPYMFRLITPRHSKP